MGGGFSFSSKAMWQRWLGGQIDGVARSTVVNFVNRAKIARAEEALFFSFFFCRQSVWVLSSLSCLDMEIYYFSEIKHIFAESLISLGNDFADESSLFKKGFADESFLFRMISVMCALSTGKKERNQERKLIE